MYNEETFEDTPLHPTVIIPDGNYDAVITFAEWAQKTFEKDVNDIVTIKYVITDGEYKGHEIVQKLYIKKNGEKDIKKCNTFGWILQNVLGTRTIKKEAVHGELYGKLVTIAVNMFNPKGDDKYKNYIKETKKRVKKESPPQSVPEEINDDIPF